MEHRRLRSGRAVSRLGFGCMGLSWAYTERPLEAREAEGVIRGALDEGVTFFDTAAAYGDGHNESIVGTILAPGFDVTIATKGGFVVEDVADVRMRRDGRPETLLSQIDASLTRLGRETIDLYYLHRVDPDVPAEESWGALAEAVTAGKVRGLGASEIDTATAQRLHAIHPLDAIQSEFSLWAREPARGQAGRPSIIEWTSQNDVILVPYAPLGRGYFAGVIRQHEALGPRDFRRRLAAFSDEGLDAAETLLEEVLEIAGEREAHPTQVALSWVLAQGDHIVPIPGTTSPRHLEENVGALQLSLDASELERLDSRLPSLA